MSRPIYDSLPQLFSNFHHSEGEDVYDSAYLVEYWEKIEQEWQNSLKVITEFSGDLNVFSDEQLDALAPFFGFAEEYYDPDWKRETKISLFSGVYDDPFIWRFRGSVGVFEYVAVCLGIDAKITTIGGFIAGISKAGDICGRGSRMGEIVVRYPSSYVTDSVERSLLDYLIQHFIPVHIHVTLSPI